MKTMKRACAAAGNHCPRCLFPPICASSAQEFYHKGRPYGLIYWKILRAADDRHNYSDYEYLITIF